MQTLPPSPCVQFGNASMRGQDSCYGLPWFDFWHHCDYELIAHGFWMCAVIRLVLGRNTQHNHFWIHGKGGCEIHQIGKVENTIPATVV